MLLDGLFKGNQTQPMHDTTAFLNNTIPIFGQFGRDIYMSDIVQTCVDCIASECSKLQPLHVRRDPITDKLIKLKGDNINRLFKYMPNPVMTTRDLIEKTIWTLYLNYNAFIYPTYDVITDASGNITGRNYTGFWPLAPTLTEWLEDATGALFVKMTFRNGKQFTFPYEDLIHLRKKYSINDIMGGGDNGQPDNQALLKTLQIHDTVLTGTAQAVQMSAGIHGVMHMNTTIGKEEDITAEKNEFLKQVGDGTGVLFQDFKGDFTPVTINPATIDSTTLSFIENKVLRWFGVSLPILNGDYTEAQHQAFYNKTIEPIVTAFNQAFSSVLFSQNELAFGNEIEFYPQKLELMSTETKLKLVDSVGNRGGLSNNFILGLFGIPPYEGGDVRMASLNYINADLMDKYQILKATKGLEDDLPDKGGNK